ncbi:hypothetical protein IW261DRAFT_1576304 [Armillaria novae-zelandiae]|uniref:DUF6534 domain-containing protein n=1 Tax=Armillaria novae-zelandiae TaxID=153914 RepID=A0AA39NBQ5_9AGAR|nr:hypothetical protein IW261DRAFT_1576304 [Armillaria novae-zelandiae]
MSETASTAAPDDTMGALLICTVISACFQGITVLCSWEYFVDHTKDRAINKVIVSVVCFIDTLHQIFISHALYIYLVKGFSDPAIMMRLLWSFLSQILLTALQGLLCQGFFTWRIWIGAKPEEQGFECYNCSSSHRKLRGHSLWVVFYDPYFGTFTYLSKITLAEAELLQLKDIAELLVIGYSANIFITVSLLFMHFRKTTQNEQTNRLVDKFTLWVLNSGLLTSLVGVFCFITEVTWPHSLLSAAMYTILCRVHGISVLAVLNSRKQRGPSNSNPPRISNEIVSTGSRAARFQFTKPGELAIHVECDTQMQYDNDIESPARPFPICFAWFTYKYL